MTPFQKGEVPTSEQQKNIWFLSFIFKINSFCPDRLSIKMVPKNPRA
jgi:hypothetical protein